jgi:hypothetical protein
LPAERIPHLERVWRIQPRGSLDTQPAVQKEEKNSPY